MAERLECLDCGTTRKVEYHMLPDRADYKAFPRCPKCLERRLATASRTLELTSPIPARWHDESYCGEKWDEDW